MPLIKPKDFCTSFFDIDFDFYLNKGFNTILLDIDNTLAPYNNLVLSKEKKDFINKTRDKGMEIILFSNNSPINIKPLADELGVKYFGHVYKPLPFGYYRVIKEFNLDKKKILCIGDQLMTDSLGANLAGLYPIYLDPLTLIDKSITFFSRTFERFVFKYIYKRKHRFNKGYVDTKTN